MISPEPIIIARLDGFSELTALIGQRLYAAAAPPDVAKPYVVYTLVSQEQDEGFGNSVGTHRSRYDFSCYATGRAEARAVADQVAAALNRYTDRTSSPPIAGCFIENRTEAFDGITALFWHLVDVAVVWWEP